MSNTMTTDSELRITFTNVAPDNEEWTAHINALNKYTTPDRYLREIIQYARSGSHYPADMHVDLIMQLIARSNQLTALEARIEEQNRTGYFKYDNGDVEIRFNGDTEQDDRLAELQQARDALKKEFGDD